MKNLAIVTGGAQGIGRALVRHCLFRRWRVVALDLDAEALEELNGEDHGGALLALQCDCSCEREVQDAFSRIAAWQREAAEPEGTDLLVNNAGIADPVSGPIEELSLENWQRLQDAHLTAAFLCSRAAVPGLRRRRGAIVNMASTRALQSEPHCEAYAAAKGGILALSHALAVSLGPEVRVNAICPGWIETGALQKRRNRSEPEHREIDHAQHPAGRVGRPEDIVHLVEYLCGAGFVTGEQFVIDGGMTRRMIYAD